MNDLTPIPAEQRRAYYDALLAGRAEAERLGYGLMDDRMFAAFYRALYGPMLAAARVDERAKVAEEVAPLLDAARVALSSGCMCDYYYGADGCTGRGNCWTPTAWTLNPDDVRAAISRQHAAAPAVVAAAGRTPTPESPGKHDAHNDHDDRQEP